MVNYDYERNVITIPVEWLHLTAGGAGELRIDDLFNILQGSLPEISRAYFNAPYTIVVWADGTKTVVKCSDEDFYDRYTGFAMCALKKVLGEKAYSKWKQTADRVCDARRLDPKRGNGAWNYAYRSDG